MAKDAYLRTGVPGSMRQRIDAPSRRRDASMCNAAMSQRVVVSVVGALTRRVNAQSMLRLRVGHLRCLKSMVRQVLVVTSQVRWALLAVLSGGLNAEVRRALLGIGLDA